LILLFALGSTEYSIRKLPARQSKNHKKGLAH
jgi:hypothetical protein